MPLPTPEFKVRLFGPDLPAAGVRGLARFENGVLVVEGQGHWYTAGAQDLDLRTGGYDGRQWIVSWHGSLGSFSAMLQSDEAMETFVGLAPSSIAPRLHKVLRQRRWSRQRVRLAWGLAGLMLFLPVFALVWFWINAEGFSRWAADKVSIQQEISLGDQAFEQMRPQLKLVPGESVADQVVESFGVRLSAGSVYPYKFHVAENPQVNAFALPGGHIVFNTGLLKSADSAAEVAGVLAHEISHVEMRHSLRAMIHALGVRAVLAVMMGDVSGGLLGGVAGKLVELDFSREQESEADLMAVKLLVRAGLPSHGLLSFFERQHQEEGLGMELPFLSTHPTSEERVAALRKAVNAVGNYPQKCLYSDWDGLRDKL